MMRTGMPGRTRHGGHFAAGLMLAALLLFGAGCAKDLAGNGVAVRNAARPAWSVSNTQEEMMIALSPVRQTLQIAGSAGTVLGAGISAAQNAAYRREINGVLGNFAPGLVFEELLAVAMAENLGPNAVRVQPMGTAAGYNSAREAAKARWAGLGRAGYDQVLDLTLTHGIFGPEGVLVTRAVGELRALPSGKLLWRDTITAHGGPVLACDRLSDPTNQLTPNITSPRLTIMPNAVRQWTEDGGVRLKTEFEQSAERTVEGLLNALGFAETPDGLLALGWNAMQRGQHDKAHELLQRAQAMDPGRPDILNVMAVNLAHNGQVDEAVSVTGELLKMQPEYGAAHFNLAWWLAKGKKNLDEAKDHYAKALALGLPEHRFLRKRLQFPE